MYSLLVNTSTERHHLRSASRNLLVAPRFQLNTYGRRAFALAAPATYNSLSDEPQLNYPGETRISTVPPSDAT